MIENEQKSRGWNNKRTYKITVQTTKGWQPVHLPRLLCQRHKGIQVPEPIPSSGHLPRQQDVEQRTAPSCQRHQSAIHNRHPERGIRL